MSGKSSVGIYITKWNETEKECLPSMAYISCLFSATYSWTVKSETHSVTEFWSSNKIGFSMCRDTIKIQLRKNNSYITKNYPILLEIQVFMIADTISNLYLWCSPVNGCLQSWNHPLPVRFWVDWEPIGMPDVVFLLISKSAQMRLH